MPPNQTHEQLISFALNTSRNIMKQKKEKEQTAPVKSYLNDIDYSLSRIIKNYQNKLSNTVYCALMDEFDAIYRDGLKYIAEMTDIQHAQLGLNKDIVEIREQKEEKSDITGTNTKEWLLKEKELKLKWFHINENVPSVCANEDIIDYANAQQHQCRHINDCAAILRVSFLLDAYYEHFITDSKKHKQTENQETDFLFMKIFNHCISGFNIVHLMDDFIHIMDHQYIENDLQCLNSGDLIQICKDKDCAADRRRYNKNKEEYSNKNVEMKEMIILEFMDSLHSFFSHQNGTVRYYNKNEINVNINQRFIRYNRQEHSKFTTYVDIDEEKEKTELSDDELFITADETPPIQSNDEFSFGIRFYYWSYFENMKKYYIKKPKHHSLKHELLTNEIYQMKIEFLQQYIETALHYLQCQKAKQMKVANKGRRNTIYEMPLNLGITMSYLVVLMTYTNMTQLQFKFKQYGTRKIKSGDGISDIKKRNMEIANWFKFLYEAVLFFGAETKPKEIFYHGISIKMYFSEFAPVFAAPISTTKSFTVAQQFSGGGIIIALKANKSCLDHSFPVYWLSDYPEEDEFLFVQAKDLIIYDIRECEASLFMQSNVNFLKAMRLLDELFKGYYVIYNTKLKTQKSLTKLLTEKRENKANENIQNHDTFYSMNLLNFWIKSKRNLYAIKSECNLLFKPLEIILFDEEKCDMKYAVMGDNRMEVCFLEEYIWNIEYDALVNAKSLKSGDFIESETYSYHLKEIDVPITFTQRFSSSVPSEPSKTGITLPGLSHTGITFHINCVVDEIKFTLNGIKTSSVVSAYLFPTKSMDTLSTLTIRLSICHSKSE